MENKFKEILESIVYIILLIIVIFASVYGSIYIRFIPLLFLLGIVGNLVFKRKIITTILGFLISLCINYLKTPLDIFYVIFVSATMSLNIVIGEALGKCIYEIVTKIKNKEKNNKKIAIYGFLSIITLVLALLIHLFTNGSVVSYNESKEKLNDYLEENYSNISKFKELNANYYLYKNPRYIFYLLNTEINEIYKFTVYVNEDNLIIDEYKEVTQKNKIDEIDLKITQAILSLDDKSKYDDLGTKVKFSKEDKITIEISKNVEKIDDTSKEEFSKEIVSYLDDIKNSGVYEKIEQLDLSLKCTSKVESIVSIVYLDDYNLVINEKTDLPYKYILKSLNMEYDY